MGDSDARRRGSREGLPRGTALSARAVSQQPTRRRLLYDLRGPFGHTKRLQLRLYEDKPSTPVGKLAGHPLTVRAIVAALQASPYLLVESLRKVEP